MAKPGVDGLVKELTAWKESARKADAYFNPKEKKPPAKAKPKGKLVPTKTGRAAQAKLERDLLRRKAVKKRRLGRRVHGRAL